MKKFMTGSIAVCAFGAVCFTGYKLGEKKEQSLGLVERIQAQGKRYIIFNKNEFKKTGKAQALSQFGQPMEEINGLITDKLPDQDLGPDWEIQEEKVYHTQILTGCEYKPPFPTPTPTPTPQPTPEPTPTPCSGTNCPDPSPTPTPQPSPTPAPSGEFQWWSRQIHAQEAQNVADTSNRTICVLDTGIDLSHPELQGQVAGGRSMLGGSYQDDQGHGTHVAGIIAAKLGNGGIAGVSKAKVYMVKVLDRNGSGLSSWIANGIVHCADLGLDISMSLGSDSPDSIIQQAVNYALSKNVLVIASAGNNGGRVGYPAAYPGVIAVSAVDKNNKLASFSSRGSQITYAGYGVDIVSLKLGGGTVSYSGTSMATPGVAAVLVFARSKGKTQAGVQNIGLPATSMGKGLADAYETVR